ncbi:MAG TPA: putative ABC exporter domain-containing protein [Gemmatimonadales bacterium]
MIDAAIYLVSRSLKNWLLVRLRKLTSPRYVTALLLGAGYLWFFLGLRHLSPGRSPAGIETANRVGALLLLLAVLRWWVFGADRTALAFSPAEIQFLFPAPVTRRQLILFKLLRAQVLLLVNVLVWTLLMRRSSSGSATVLHAFALWVLFSTLFLHRLGAALVRSEASERVRSRPRAFGAAVMGILIILIAALLGVQLSGVGLALPGGSSLELLRRGWDWLGTPAGHALLFPFRLLLAPVMATTLSTWAHAIGPAAGLLALHLIWVIRADRGFEEAAIEASQRRAELMERWRREGRPAIPQEGRVRLSLPLSPSGHPIPALVWKNLSKTVREDRPSMLFAAVVVLVVGAAIGAVGDGREGASSILFALGASWVVLLVFFGPQWIRNDLRADLTRLSVLRTFPVSGTTLMTGEVISSAVVLSLYQLMLLAVTAIGALGATRMGLTPGYVVRGLVVAAFVVPALNVVAMGIQNAGALLFPAWVRTDMRPGGVEALGQHLISGTLCLLLLVLAALPPAVIGYAIALLVYPSWGWAALIPATLLAVAALVLEAFLLLDWLGGRFDSLDLSELA